MVSKGHGIAEAFTANKFLSANMKQPGLVNTVLAWMGNMALSRAHRELR
jgi:hypothetical protein